MASTAAAAITKLLTELVEKRKIIDSESFILPILLRECYHYYVCRGG